MRRLRPVDAVKVTANIAVTTTASVWYLYHHSPTTCENFAAVAIAIGANLFGLIQNPPTTKPTPEDLLREMAGR